MLSSVYITGFNFEHNLIKNDYLFCLCYLWRKTGQKTVLLKLVKINDLSNEIKTIMNFTFAILINAWLISNKSSNWVLEKSFTFISFRERFRYCDRTWTPLVRFLCIWWSVPKPSVWSILMSHALLMDFTRASLRFLSSLKTKVSLSVSGRKEPILTLRS